MHSLEPIDYYGKQALLYSHPSTLHESNHVLTSHAGLKQTSYEAYIEFEVCLNSLLILRMSWMVRKFTVGNFYYLRKVFVCVKFSVIVTRLELSGI